MIEIPLTQGKTALVDDCDSYLLNYRWWCAKGYAVRAFQETIGKQKVMYLHHCITGFPLNGKRIDHIDRNPLNNSRNNLRIVTSKENAENHSKSKTSKYVGVHWCNQKKKWLAKFMLNNKKYYMGGFTNEEEAYNASKVELGRIVLR